MTTGEVAASRSKNVRQAANSRSEPMLDLDSEEGKERRLDPACAPSGLGRAPGRSRRSGRASSPRRPPSTSPARPRTISPRAQNVIPSPYAGLRPACHQTRSSRPSRCLRNSQASRDFPIPPGPDHAHQTWPALSARGLEQVLELAKLLVPADERRLERIAPVPPAALGDDPDGPPGLDGAVLALEGVVARVLEDDRARRGPFGGLADEHGPRLRDRLQSRGRVDEVTGDHALVGGPDRHGRLARQDACPGLDAGTQRPNRVDQLKSGTDGPLGVILTGDRGAPDGHHRIADELLDRAAILADHVAGKVEIAREGLAHIFGVARGGVRREAHEIGEQDAHQAALRARLGTWRDRSDGGGRGPGRLRAIPGRRLALRRRAVSRTRSRTWRLGRWRTRTPGRPLPAAWRTRHRTSRRGGSRSRSSGRSRRDEPPARGCGEVGIRESIRGPQRSAAITPSCPVARSVAPG